MVGIEGEVESDGDVGLKGWWESKDLLKLLCRGAVEMRGENEIDLICLDRNFPPWDWEARTERARQGFVGPTGTTCHGSFIFFYFF